MGVRLTRPTIQKQLEEWVVEPVLQCVNYLPTCHFLCKSRAIVSSGLNEEVNESLIRPQRNDRDSPSAFLLAL